MTHSIYDTGMYLAVEKAGSVAKLATVLGVTRAATYEWLQRGWAPLKRAIQIEELYGIPRNRLIKPELTQALSGSRNPQAKAGAVRYEPRPRPKPDEISDLC